jgi:hypothetical protein
MSNARRLFSLPVSAVLLLAAAPLLAACSSAIDMIPNQVGGLPATAPARPEQPPEYPNIYATPAPRETQPLNEAEQKQLEKELIQARDRQSGARPEPESSTGAAKNRREAAEGTPKKRSP